MIPTTKKIRFLILFQIKCFLLLSVSKYKMFVISLEHDIKIWFIYLIKSIQILMNNIF